MKLLIEEIAKELCCCEIISGAVDLYFFLATDVASYKNKIAMKDHTPLPNEYTVFMAEIQAIIAAGEFIQTQIDKHKYIKILCDSQAALLAIKKEEEKKRRKAIQGKCYRCASADHMIPGCKVPATVTCKLCNIQGHISPACLKSTSSARASAADSSPDSGQLQLQYSPSSTTASSFYVPQPYQEYNQPTPQLPL